MSSKELNNFIFEDEYLKYESYLKGFSKEKFDEFDAIAEKIGLDSKIKDLMDSKIVNETENQAALHHVYRDLYASSPKNYVSKDLIESCRLNIERCISLKQDLIKKGIKNIVTIGTVSYTHLTLPTKRIV